MHNGNIIFNGISSVNFGIIVEQVPNLNRPTRKFKTYEVPGRSGTIIEQQDAYANIDRQYQIWFTDPAWRNDYTPAKARYIAEWLYNTNGYVRLEDNFEPDYFRLAYFNGPLNIESTLLMIGKATISFNCRPERFDKEGEQWFENPTTITNKYAFSAKPLIKIEGSGNGTFTIQGQTVTITGMTDYLYIDCESQDCYRQTAENRNNLMTGNFPVLKPGDNTITKSGGITKISIQPRFWTL